jgi:hypothetical protein
LLVLCGLEEAHRLPVFFDPEVIHDVGGQHVFRLFPIRGSKPEPPKIPSSTLTFNLQAS